MAEITRTVRDSSELKLATKWVEVMVGKALTAGEVLITLGRPKRSNDQNAMMWALLTDVSKQVDWHGHRLSPDDWKQVFTASLLHQRAVPGIDGGFVVLGTSTSKMSKQTLSDLIELILAFGAEHDVTWSEGED